MWLLAFDILPILYIQYSVKSIINKSNSDLKGLLSQSTECYIMNLVCLNVPKLNMKPI